MPIENTKDVVGEFQSPGGFIFGVQGWTWGEQRPSSITFFLDGTAKVSDQWGRPIPGVVKEGRAIYFAKCTHLQVLELLAEERIDWLELPSAGWPQLPYDKLKQLKVVPPTPLDDLRKIKDDTLRRDALRFRREHDERQAKELDVASAE